MATFFAGKLLSFDKCQNQLTKLHRRMRIAAQASLGINDNNYEPVFSGEFEVEGRIFWPVEFVSSSNSSFLSSVSFHFCLCSPL